MLGRLSVLVAILALGSAAIGQNADDTKIAGLIKRLGSSSFMQREIARKELEAIGPAALEPLRQASKNADVETKRRITDLIRVFEEKQATEVVLAPKEIHFKLKDATVQQGIAELARLSGYTIQFFGDATKVNDKKITLDTGKVPFWDAVGRFCDAAGLMEKLDPNSIATSIDKRGKRGVFLPPPRLGRPDLIALMPRTQEKLFISRAGSVKTELRVHRDANAKEVVLTFIVTPEPRLLNAQVVGRPTIEKILDVAGRTPVIIPDAPRPEPGPNDPPDMIDIDMPLPIRRAVQVRLKEDKDGMKTLKEIAGKVTLQTDLPNEPIVRMPNVMASAGKSSNAASGGSLKVDAVKKLDNGDIEVQVTMDNLVPNPFNDAVVINGGNVMIRGRVNIQGMIIGPNGVRITSSGDGTTDDLPNLFDTKGQKFKLTEVRSDSNNIVNGSYSRTATIIYQANPGQAAPSELVVHGMRNLAIGIPFRFENVPIP